jgi:hypothetical protein
MKNNSSLLRHLRQASFITQHLSLAAGAALYAQMAESAKLDETIRANLVGLGFGEPKGDATNG